MTPLEKQWIFHAATAAIDAEHIYPRMAACEAALESDYGQSELAMKALNFFGMKQHQHPEYGTLNLPTKEVLDGKWVPTTAEWVIYPSFKACFQDRMGTLLRLQGMYPHYAAALRAGSPELYVAQVSLTWSTDPKRGEKVLAIYNMAFPVPNSQIFGGQ